MIRGSQHLLTLMVGPAVPVPVPQTVLDALTEVSISISARSASGFQLSFEISNNSPLQTLFLLSGGATIPLLRVVIVVTVNGTPQVLIDGVVKEHSIAPGVGSQPATLTIMGSDLTEVMNYPRFSNPPGTPFPAMPPFTRVLTILAKYAALGIIPKALPSVLLDVPLPTDRVPQQKGTDLDYIQQLADEVGYVFYLEPGPAPLTSCAYWGPEIKVGQPQPALNVDMDAYTNVESLSFRFDDSAKMLPIVTVQNPTTKVPIPIPIPDITPLNPLLGAVSPIPQQFEVISDSAKYSPVRATMMGLAKAARSAEAVTGSGSLDVLRYGRLLKARELVGVRGAGVAFDGLYYVNNVTHTITRDAHKQSFELSRNGLVSTVSQVPA
ncbi:hypothetical protein [Adonisia turfae]|uniref:Uncharacterized protein n=1 Tax=Adonisia turfae CCMR0081 TaxID=2292702 RepID=A0A6M0RJ97_9CYAN|nr:hypothetical protein [Adonisia turfae]NEZ56229.1 hypothetical protein [Adonisia turfae CCMR0081]